MGLPKSQRIRRQAEFEEIRRAGLRFHCRAFVMQVLPKRGPASAGTLPSRVGVIASRRVGKAHDRNKAKRILRELFRKHHEQLPRRSDVVLVARRGLLDTPFADTERLFLKLAGLASKACPRDRPRDETGAKP